jgi:hypothetical protein
MSHRCRTRTSNVGYPTLWRLKVAPPAVQDDASFLSRQAPSGDAGLGTARMPWRYQLPSRRVTPKARPVQVG